MFAKLLRSASILLFGAFAVRGELIDNIPYLAWNEDSQGFVEAICDYAEVVTEETDSFSYDTWYVVTNKVTCGPIEVDWGAAHLILMDGASLTVKGGSYQAGIEISDAASLEIYSQSGGTGKLTATGGEMAAGIGGAYWDCGSVTINGGIIEARGGRNSAGLGGQGKVGTVTIRGGKITVSGDEDVPAIGSHDVSFETAVAISGGVFSMPLEDAWVADGYGAHPNTDPETKDAYPYTVFQEAAITVGALERVTARWTNGAVTNAIAGTSFTAKVGETVTVLVSPTDATYFLYGGDAAYTFVVPQEDLDISDRLPKAALYLDANGNPQTRDDYILVTAETTTFASGKWYVVNSDVSRGTINVSGAAHLILCDGAKLTVQGGKNQAGLHVPMTKQIIIYGQRADTGTLQATGGELGAGIGGAFHENGGTVVINGGTVTATGCFSAGIGGGAATTRYTDDTDPKGGVGGTVTINGGTVTATGGVDSAGIGGGYSLASGYGHGGSVTINGGTVVAAGDFGAGIGGGRCGNGGTVEINGGRMKISGRRDVIIGRGYEGWDDGTVSITGGYFDMTVQESWLASGYSVMANQDAATCGEFPWMVAPGWRVTVGKLSNMTAVWTCEGSGVTNEVTATSFNVPRDATVTISFTPRVNFSFAGKRFESLTLTVAQDLDISEQVPKAEPSAVEYLDKNGELRTIALGSYTLMTAETTTLGNGWYVVADPKVSPERLSVTGNAHLILGDRTSLTLQGVEKRAGLSVPSGKSLSIYGQRAGTGVLQATGGIYGAGIGGDMRGSGGHVEINGGTVTAIGGASGSGIGGGGDWSTETAGAGGTVEIYGGRVSATGQNGADAIGSGVNYRGKKSSAGRTSISGGVFAMELKDDWSADWWLPSVNDDPETCQAYPWTVVPACRVTVGELKNLSVAWTFGDGAVTNAASGPYFHVYSNMSATVIFTPANGYWLEGELIWERGVVTEDQDLTDRVPVARPNELAYVKENGAGGTVSDYAVVHATTNALGSGWHAVLDADVTCERMTVTGAAKLILGNGARLSVLNGISVADGASLTVYGQAGNGGFLEALGGVGEPGIGGTGAVTIVGGTVTAAGDGDGVPGIGAKSVVIRGGSVGASVLNARDASGMPLYRVTIEGLGTAAPTFADLPSGYGTAGISPIDGAVYLWWPNGTYGFKVNGEIYCATVNGANAVAVKAVWTIGTGVTAAWADGVLTISGKGTIDDFASAADVPWQGLPVTNVMIPTEVKPGRNLLAGLGDTTTVNGAAVSLIRQLSGDFLVGAVAPAEATALEIDGGEVSLTVEVDASTDLKTWKPAKTVEIAVPVEGEKGFYILKSK